MTPDQRTAGHLYGGLGREATRMVSATGKRADPVESRRCNLDLRWAAGLGPDHARTGPAIVLP